MSAVTTECAAKLEDYRQRGDADAEYVARIRALIKCVETQAAQKDERLSLKAHGACRIVANALKHYERIQRIVGLASSPDADPLDVEHGFMGALDQCDFYAWVCMGAATDLDKSSTLADKVIALAAWYTSKLRDDPPTRPEILLPDIAKVDPVLSSTIAPRQSQRRKSRHSARLPKSQPN
jgi:hypothetical protein